MIKSLSLQAVMLTTVAFGALCAGAGVANADGFSQTNLVSNMPGLAAVTDPNLVNPWGVSFLPGSPIWISNQGTSTSTLYPVVGGAGVSPTPFTVNIPPAGGPGPTGQVANGGTSFDVGMGGNGKPANFIFANLNGSISAWNGAPTLTQVFTQTTVAGASFTGLAINQAKTMLFAANDAGTGGIDVFNSDFTANTTLASGAFATPTAVSAAGFVPFDVKDIGGNVFVTYAPSGHIPQTRAMPGDGAVAEFSEAGTLESLSTASADSKLASPWGIALAPMSFGKFGGDLLVGNFTFGDSVINAFDPIDLGFRGLDRHRSGRRKHGGRSLVPGFRRRRKRRKPEHPLLYRRHQRGDRRALRVDRRGPGAIDLGDDDSSDLAGLRCGPRGGAAPSPSAERTADKGRGFGRPLFSEPMAAKPRPGSCVS